MILQAQEAITAGGALSANWWLIGITGVAGVFFAVIFIDIRQSLKSVVSLAQLHDKEISTIKNEQSHQSDWIDKHDEETKEVNQEIRRGQMEIITKLRAITPN